MQRQFKSMGEDSCFWRVKLRSALIMKSTGEDLGSRLLAPWEWVEVKPMNQRTYELWVLIIELKFSIFSLTSNTPGILYRCRALFTSVAERLDEIWKAWEKISFGRKKLLTYEHVEFESECGSLVCNWAAHRCKCSLERKGRLGKFKGLLRKIASTCLGP